jgi:hypothetical protein
MNRQKCKRFVEFVEALSINRSDSNDFYRNRRDFKEVVDYSVKLNFPEDVIHFVGEKILLKLPNI